MIFVALGGLGGPVAPGGGTQGPVGLGWPWSVRVRGVWVCPVQPWAGGLTLPTLSSGS